MTAAHALGASLAGGSKAITIGARHVKRTRAARCRPMMPKSNEKDAESVASYLQTTSESWEKQVSLIATICPLAYMFPSTAQAAAQASAGLAEDCTVPLLLSALLAGAVFGIFNDKETKRILEEQMSGIRRVCIPSPLCFLMHDTMTYTSVLCPSGPIAVSPWNTKAQQTAVSHSEIAVLEIC